MTKSALNLGQGFKVLVFWNSDKANNFADKLNSQGKTVIMSRMMRAGSWAYSVKFNQ